MLGGHLKNKISNKKHKNEKNMTLNRPRKGRSFIVGELKPEGTASTP